jgi:hypothetical protein
MPLLIKDFQTLFFILAVALHPTYFIVFQQLVWGTAFLCLSLVWVEGWLGVFRRQIERFELGVKGSNSFQPAAQWLLWVSDLI